MQYLNEEKVQIHQKVFLFRPHYNLICVISIHFQVGYLLRRPMDLPFKRLLDIMMLPNILGSSRIKARNETIFIL